MVLLTRASSVFRFLFNLLSVDHGRDSLYNKIQEFRAWLVEERKINPETQSKESTRKEFAQFMEDYNTGSYSCSTRLRSDERADMSSDIASRKVLQYGCL